MPLEYVILKQSVQAEADHDLRQDMVDLVQLQAKIEKIMQDNPKTVAVLKMALNGLEWIADRVTDGVAMAAGGAYGLVTEGFEGVASGAQAGLHAKEAIGEAAAYAIDRIVDVATEKYVQSGRTAREKSQFQKTIDFFKDSSLSVFGLIGMRHFVKPTPTGKAYSAVLRKSFERKVTVKDGIVYAGEKNLGNIKDMPTIRTFKKPTDPVLRKEFQSDVFDREVMYHGIGTGYNYRVYQRNDIDWYQIRTKGLPEFIGKSNLEAAKNGLAPQLSDGTIVNLHHIGQNAFGPLVEVSAKKHSPVLHKLYGYQQKHPNNPVDRASFDTDRAIYWKERAAHVK